MLRATDEPRGRESRAGSTSGRRAGNPSRFRSFWRRHPALDLTYRIGVAVAGSAIVVAGIGLIPLPGPGWLIVFAGLAVLATEFTWADRLQRFARAKVSIWTDWVMRRSRLVRLLIGLASLAVVAASVTLYVRLQGIPLIG